MNNNNRPLYGVWLKMFRGWLCDGLGNPYCTYSLGEAVTRLLIARARLNTENVMSPISGDAFPITHVYEEAKEKMVVRSFDEWAESEGLIE